MYAWFFLCFTQNEMALHNFTLTLTYVQCYTITHEYIYIYKIKYIYNYPIDISKSIYKHNIGY